MTLEIQPVLAWDWYGSRDIAESEKQQIPHPTLF
jgi:hypothetical protein